MYVIRLKLSTFKPHGFQSGELCACKETEQCLEHVDKHQGTNIRNKSNIVLMLIPLIYLNTRLLTNLSSHRFYFIFCHLSKN